MRPGVYVAAEVGRVLGPGPLLQRPLPSGPVTKKGTAAVLLGMGCASGPYSLACAAGLDGERFPCKPEARARESVLRTQQNRSNPEINE